MPFPHTVGSGAHCAVLQTDSTPDPMKYLAAKAGVPTEHRLRALRMVKDLIGHGFDGAWFRKETGGRAKKAAA